MILYIMKVLFTIWAKVGTIRGRGRGREEEEQHRRAQKRPFAPEKLDEKIIQNIWYVKIIVYLCCMKTKTKSVMKKVEKNEVVPLLAIIATGVTCAGILLGGATLAVVGVTMYLIPIYVALCGIKHF